jgi:TBC1 domain family protein 5
MLLMRYPSPVKEQSPRTFVLDARYLRSNRSIEAGNDLVKKYSDRVPEPFKREYERLSTPDYSTSPGTPQSHRSRSPFISPGVPTAFESLINDAARGVITRGEKWGLNQAVRDAVGEVKKNVQNIQAGRGSPRASIMGSGHRSSKSSETAGNIAANVLRKMNALQDRNKQLAKMLERAVADLWDCEKEAADKKAISDDTLEAFSVAVAKVQFVQVFLQDSTLPLPQEENQNPAATKQPAKERNTSSAAEAQQPGSEQINQPVPSQPDKDPALQPLLTPSPMPVVVKPMSTGSPPPSVPTTSVSAHHASATALSVVNQLPTAPSEKFGNNARPRIGQSSYSWMLGQAHENSSDFVRASPFAPAEKRHQGKNAKGFLFGEDNDVVGERRVVKGRTRKGSKDARRGATGSLAPEHEDIGLDEVKRDVEET